MLEEAVADGSGWLCESLVLVTLDVRNWLGARSLGLHEADCWRTLWAGDAVYLDEKSVKGCQMGSCASTSPRAKSQSSWSKQ